MREGEAENSPLGSPTSIGTWRIPQRKKGGIPHRVVQHPRHPTPVPSRPPSLPSAVFSTHLKAAFSRPITSLHPWSTPKPAARTPPNPSAPQNPGSGGGLVPGDRLGLVLGAVGAAFALTLGMETVFGQEEASEGTRPALVSLCCPNSPRDALGVGPSWHRGTPEPWAGDGADLGVPAHHPGPSGSGMCLTGTAGKRGTNGEKKKKNTKRSREKHQPGRAGAAEPGQNPNPGRAGAVPTTGTLRTWGSSRSSAHPALRKRSRESAPRSARAVRGLHRNAPIITQRSGGSAPGQGTPCSPHAHPMPTSRGVFPSRGAEGALELSPASSRCPPARTGAAPLRTRRISRTGPAMGKTAGPKENKSKC